MKGPEHENYDMLRLRQRAPYFLLPPFVERTASVLAMATMGRAPNDAAAYPWKMELVIPAVEPPPCGPSTHQG